MRTAITTVSLALFAGSMITGRLGLARPAPRPVAARPARPAAPRPVATRPLPKPTTPSGAGGVARCPNSKEFSFGAAATYPEKQGTSGGIAVGDVNGDGLDDIVTGNAHYVDGATSVGVLINKGDGTFAPMKTYKTIEGADPRSISLGDLNGDGKLDIVTAGSGNNNYSEYLLNNGDGTFGTAVRLETGTGTGFYNRGNGFIRTGDLNGDHKVDIVEVSGAYLGIWLNSGKANFAGSITPPRLERPGTDGDASYLSDVVGAALADFDGDGRLDLVLADQSYGYVLLNDHHGQFAAPAMYPLQTAGAGHGNMMENGVVAADFNGDGKPDLATLGNANQTGSQSINVLLNKGDGTLGAAARYIVGDFDNSSLVAGDFNGDGKADLAVSMSEAGILVFMNKGDGTFAKPFTIAASGARQMAVGKFTKSGVRDIAAIHVNHGPTDKAGPVFVVPGVCE